MNKIYTSSTIDPDPEIVKKFILELGPKTYDQLLKATNSSTITSLSSLICPKSKPRKNIPRPQNPFIIYRRVFSKNFRLKKESFSSVSRRAGDNWKREDLEVKDVYQTIAKLAKKIHEHTYPDYRFYPKRRNDKKKPTRLRPSPPKNKFSQIVLPPINTLFDIHRDRFSF
jgi:hypothetical protein